VRASRARLCGARATRGMRGAAETFNVAVSATAAQRNKAHVARVVDAFVRSSRAGREKKFELLELGCGVGAHAAEILRVTGEACLKKYYPTDVGDHDGTFAAVMENCAASGTSGTCAAPRAMDARTMVDDVEAESLDGVLAVNVVHISSRAATLGMFAGSAKALRKGGFVFVYGPFKVGGEFRSEGDARFDASLRLKDPENFGLVDLEWMDEQARLVGLTPASVDGMKSPVEMPANNLTLVYTK